MRHLFSASSAVWRPSAHIQWVSKDESVTVIDPQEGRVYHFNAAGAAMWDVLSRGASLETIVRQTAQQFDAPEKKIRKDAERFIKELRSDDLIMEASPSELPD